MNPNDPRLDALQRYADGTATRKDVATVERAIIEDAEFRTLAVEYLHLDSAMEEFAVVRDAAPVAMPVHRARWALAAAAAVVMIGLSLWRWWPEKNPIAPAKIARAEIAQEKIAQVEIEVLQLRDAKIAGANAGMQIHDRVRLDSFDLRSGEAQLRLPSDVKFVVSGPAELRFMDAMHARVLHGKVTVDCGARGKGFILDTPVARVVDMGTQFGVEARADGATDVMVIKGSVDLINPQRPKRPTQLEQGEAVRVDAKQAVARIVNITGGLQPGEWSTQPPPDDCNIRSVSDNFGAAEALHFYRTVPHGLRPGAVVYTNRPYVWRAVKGQNFPASLMNADVVQTFHDELSRRDYAIEIVVARPVELFVLMQRRGNPQGWLTENFTCTGEEISLDESGSDSHPLFFEVWKRTVPQAGKVTLGPTNRDDNGRPTGMYGIAAKALSP